MSALVRLQFKKRPSAFILGQIIAAAAFDDDFEDMDILEDAPERSDARDE